MSPEKKIRIEADPSKVLSFIEQHDYPYQWHLETFKTHCISLRIEEGNPASVVAYVWATWERPGLLDIHACSARRLWLSRELLTRLYIIAELFGAGAVQTTARSPTIRRLLHNVGWEREGEVYRKTLDKPIELSQPQNPPADSNTGRPASGDSGDGAYPCGE